MKRESEAKEQETSGATSSNGPCADRGRENQGTGIVVFAVVDAANRSLGTRDGGRQWRTKGKDFRGGGRSASGASPHGERIHAGSG